MSKSDARSRIIAVYCALAKSKGFHPSRNDMIGKGVSRDKIRHHFGSYSGLRKAAVQDKPSVFKHFLEETVFSKRAMDQLTESAAGSQRFFISTAVLGCKTHTGFLKAIDNFGKRRKSMAIFLTAMDPAGNQSVFALSKELRERFILGRDMALNQNLFLSSILLSAKHIDPITGLERLGQRNGSFIYASPKQRLKLTATSNTKLPHAIMTTGAVTRPYYGTDRYMSKRTAYIAESDHVMGGLIVEIENEVTFHFRQVQADSRGRFIDLGVQYSPNGQTKRMRPEALVLGDWHSGETDETARKAFLFGPNSVADVTQPKRLIIHDGFNGLSINHHELGNAVLKAQRARDGQLSLKDELDLYAVDLEHMCAKPYIEEVVIDKSNHDDFLDKYLARGFYLQDPHNHALALELAKAAVEGKNPIQVYVEKRGFPNRHKLRWLKRDEDYKIAGIELGAHGDKGLNGARGSIASLEKAYGSVVSGHDHTPGILRSSYKVGTCSKLKVTYNEGPSSWLHTSCLVYSTGQRQLINVIYGSWRLP